MMGVGYSTVSQGRKRLREKLKKDKSLSEPLKELKQICQWSEKDLKDVKEFQKNVEDLEKVDKKIWK